METMAKRLSRLRKQREWEYGRQILGEPYGALPNVSMR